MQIRQSAAKSATPAPPRTKVKRPVWGESGRMAWEPIGASGETRQSAAKPRCGADLKGGSGSLWRLLTPPCLSRPLGNLRPLLRGEPLHPASGAFLPTTCQGLLRRDSFSGHGQPVYLYLPNRLSQNKPNSILTLAEIHEEAAKYCVKGIDGSASSRPSGVLAGSHHGSVKLPIDKTKKVKGK
jgi:hypothetical protein